MDIIKHTLYKIYIARKALTAARLNAELALEGAQPCHTEWEHHRAASWRLQNPAPHLRAKASAIHSRSLPAWVQGTQGQQ